MCFHITVHFCSNHSGPCCVKAREFSSSSSSWPSETPKMEFVLRNFPFFHRSPITEPIRLLRNAISHWSWVRRFGWTSGVYPPATFPERPLETEEMWNTEATRFKQTKPARPRRDGQCHVCSPLILTSGLLRPVKWRDWSVWHVCDLEAPNTELKLQI